jgi:hypothetical protein
MLCVHKGLRFMEYFSRIIRKPSHVRKVTRAVPFQVIYAQNRGNWNLYRSMVSQQIFPNYQIMGNTDLVMTATMCLETLLNLL